MTQDKERSVLAGRDLQAALSAFPLSFTRENYGVRNVTFTRFHDAGEYIVKPCREIRSLMIKCYKAKGN